MDKKKGYKPAEEKRGKVSGGKGGVKTALLSVISSDLHIFRRHKGRPLQGKAGASFVKAFSESIFP